MVSLLPGTVYLTTFGVWSGPCFIDISFSFQMAPIGVDLALASGSHVNPQDNIAQTLAVGRLIINVIAPVWLNWA